MSGSYAFHVFELHLVLRSVETNISCKSKALLFITTITEILRKHAVHFPKYFQNSVSSFIHGLNNYYKLNREREREKGKNSENVFLLSISKASLYTFMLKQHIGFLPDESKPRWWHICSSRVEGLELWVTVAPRVVFALCSWPC